MSIKHRAFPQLQTAAQPTHPRHPLTELYAVMTWWERISSALVLAATIGCFILLVLLLA